MPWPPDQARAIAISYKRRGKKPSAEVGAALSDSLRGVPAPDGSGARHKLAKRMVKKRKHHRKRHR